MASLKVDYTIDADEADMNIDGLLAQAADIMARPDEFLPVEADVEAVA